jgi:hypothetical protein
MSDTDVAAPRTRRPLVIALAVLLIAALAYGLIVVLNPGDGVQDVDQTQAVAGSEPAGVASEPTVVTPETPPEAEGTEEPSEAGTAEPSFEVFNARDPFDQLAIADSGAVTDTEDTAATPAVDTGPGTTTPADGTGPGTTTPADGTPSGSGEPAQTSVGTTTIRLDEVFDEDGEEKVIIQVGGDGYEAAEGETVADDLTVLDIADSCATMRLDDTRFILCEGEQIRK